MDLSLDHIQTLVQLVDYWWSLSQHGPWLVGGGVETVTLGDFKVIELTKAVDGLAVDGLAVNGLAVDGLAVDGLAEDRLCHLRWMYTDSLEASLSFEFGLGE